MDSQASMLQTDSDLREIARLYEEAEVARYRREYRVVIHDHNREVTKKRKAKRKQAQAARRNNRG